MKDSVVLLEVLVATIILSFIVVGSSKFILKLYKINEKNFNYNIAKIDLDSTRIFLEKQLSSGVDIELKLSHIPKSKKAFFLRYDGKVLLDGVTQFNIKKISQIYYINICIKRRYNICKSWIF
ncbi:MAG: hypothetical protein B1H07_02875 [Campylobacteraceae bacterium 4484_166]|nr:MAG: hypothetical protein B1H07_02875 [Campylobacteraceae bacterium 4484_166]